MQVSVQRVRQAPTTAIFVVYRSGAHYGRKFQAFMPPRSHARQSAYRAGGVGRSHGRLCCPRALGVVGFLAACSAKGQSKLLDIVCQLCALYRVVPYEGLREIEINDGTVVSNCGITLPTAKKLQLEPDDLNIRGSERIKHNARRIQ